jgi:hypothetical protein
MRYFKYPDGKVYGLYGCKQLDQYGTTIGTLVSINGLEVPDSMKGLNKIVVKRFEIKKDNDNDKDI